MKLMGLVLFAIAHGYFAAWLAVWMLFHPRKPWFLFGCRIPFTPGLLPASRGKLEHAIADAVAGKLLLPDTLENAANRQGIPRMLRSTLPEHFDRLSEDPEFLDTVSKAAFDVVKEYLRKHNGLKDEIEQKGLVPYGKTFGLSFDSIWSSLWGKIEEAVERACRSRRFRNTVQGSIKKLATDLKDDTSTISFKVEETAGKMVGSAVGALDVHAIIIERLEAFSDEELEELVTQTAGHHLQSIKNVAALIGVFFGLFSILLFR
jgi:uncharacterized membrane protein YheB (UPF0754 family)